MEIVKRGVVNAVLSVVTIVFLFVKLETVFSSDIVTTDGKVVGNPCSNADLLIGNSKEKERWLKSAQLIAFCFEEVRIILPYD